MKNKLLLAVAVLTALSQHIAVAQNNFKFGKISDEELAMTSYASDTSSVAVCLFKIGETKFTYNPSTGEFGTDSHYSYRIKVLKPEGKKYADVSIPFYVSNTSNGIKESVKNIKAVSYTLVDGKIKENELPKKYIFEEKSSENWRVMKFSIPNVEVGSVIEYKYTHQTNNPFHLNPWAVQSSIPVQYAKYEIEVPEYFYYKADTRGYERIVTTKENTAQLFNGGIGSSSINVPCHKWTFVSDDIPAIKDEPYLWCINDYLTCVEFELDGVKFPGSYFQSYASSWEDVKTTLKKFERFGGLLSLKNPYQDEMRAMNVSELPFEEKLRTVFKILKDKLKWNGKYRLNGDDVKETVKQGSGSNADLNFILMAMLRDAGIKSKPVLLRTRSEGRLPFRATVDKLNTFIVVAYDSEGTPYYLDSSIEYGDINILPPVLMVSQAILFDDAKPTQFVDLSNIGRQMTSHTINATIQPDGTLEGTRQTIYTGQGASGFKQRMSNEKDSLSTIQEIEELYNINVEELQTQMTEGLGERCNSLIHFKGEVLSSDDHIYLNPMVFPDKKSNPFTNANRKFPVEFPYAESVLVNTILTLPEGYQVEEIPQSKRGTMNNKELDYLYMVQQQGNKVILRYKATINTSLVMPDQYEELRKFWEDMTSCNNQQIVLKKITVQP